MKRIQLLITGMLFLGPLAFAVDPVYEVNVRTCLNLRAKAKSKSRRLGCVKGGSQVRILKRARRGVFHYVETADGRRGYLSGNYLKKFRPKPTVAARSVIIPEVSANRLVRPEGIPALPLRNPMRSEATPAFAMETPDSPVRNPARLVFNPEPPSPVTNMNEQLTADFDRQSAVEMVAKELKCSAEKHVGVVRDGKVIRDLAEAFVDGWAYLNQIGRPVPSPEERRHLYAQMVHESIGFKAMTEAGKSTRFSRYRGGAKFRGRGPIQLTHCYNYVGCARFLSRMEKGVDDYESLVPNNDSTECSSARDVAKHPLMTNPESVIGKTAQTKYHAGMCSLWWWENMKAVDSDFEKALKKRGNTAVTFVSKGVNCGGANRKCKVNHLDRRLAIYNKIGGCINEGRKLELAISNRSVSQSRRASLPASSGGFSIR